MGRGGNSANDGETLRWKSSSRPEGVGHGQAPAAARSSPTLAERSDGQNSEIHAGKQKPFPSPSRGIPSFSGCASKTAPLRDAATEIKNPGLPYRQILKYHQSTSVSDAAPSEG